MRNVEHGGSKSGLRTGHDMMSQALVMGFIFKFILLAATFSSGAADLATDTQVLLSMKEVWGNRSSLADWSTLLSTCSWPGVACDQHNTSVVALGMDGSGPLFGGLDLNSSIPEVIGGLVNLEELTMTSVGLIGKIPTSLGSLTRLTYLDLSYNLLTGVLPEGISNLQNLTNLVLSSNLMDGVIPSSYGDFLLQLQTLDLSSIGVVGTIPSSFGNFTKLTFLDLSENSLRGDLPSSLGNLTSLTYMSLMGVHLNSTFPEVITNLINLQELSMSSCDLIGEIPPSIASLKMLSYLDLHSNNFIGNLPQSLVNITKLGYLLLDGIPFNSTMPEVIPKLVNLDGLSMSGCGLIGEIPASISALTKLQEILLSNNALSGPIPDSFWNTPFLRNIDFSNNNLSGRIPDSLWNQTILQNLILSDNNLEGGIPYDFGVVQSLYLLSLSNNKLSGPLPDFGSQFLSSIHLGDNMFSGVIPNTIGKLGGMIFRLSLPRNRLSGPIPASLSDCNQLELVDLSENMEINGSLPEIPTPLLRVFMVGHNNLIGEFPPWIIQAPKLQILDLSGNNFYGILPTNLSLLQGFVNPMVTAPGPFSSDNTLYQESLVIIGNGVSLDISYVLSTRTSFDVSENYFNGSIPSELGELKGLLYLTLFGNKFTGAIPTAFQYLVNLESLDLSSNRLSGPIPSVFASSNSLNSLQYFNVSHNNLSGPIPSGPHFDTFTNIFSLFEDNPGLCGPPLNSCLSTPPPSSPINQAHQGSGIRGWISFLAMGVGFGIGFIGVSLVFIYGKNTRLFVYKPRRPPPIYKYDRPYGVFAPKT